MSLRVFFENIWLPFLRKKTIEGNGEKTHEELFNLFVERIGPTPYVFKYVFKHLLAIAGGLQNDFGGLREYPKVFFQKTI